MIEKVLLHIGKNLGKARCKLISMVCSKYSWVVFRDSTTPWKFCTFYLTFALLKNFNFIMKCIALFPISTPCLNVYLYNLKKYEITKKKKKTIFQLFIELGELKQSRLTFKRSTFLFLFSELGKFEWSCQINILKSKNSLVHLGKPGSTA